MLAEFLAKIVDLGKKANQVEFHTHPGLPESVFVRHGDDMEEMTSPPPFRQHKLAGFEDLVVMLRNDRIALKPEVYVGPTAVCAFLDGRHRREVVVVSLVESKRLQLCAALQTPRSFQPRDAVKLLRLELHGGQHDHVIQALSRIDFARSSTGKTNVDHGRETLGRTVEALVQQADAVPQRFVVGVPMWTTAGFTRYGVNIEFGVHLDLEGQTVELRVLSDEIDRVRNQALAAVAKDLQEALDAVPVFLGTP